MADPSFGKPYKRFYRLLSPLYFQKINNTLEAFNKQYNARFRMGDYLFDDEEEAETTTPIDTLRKNFIANCMSDTRPLLTRLKGKPLYQPAHIYVLTDADTFSAAFHYAFYLWKMGATVVGVPSSQAPNTFMEQTPFTLPRCGLQGSISNSLQQFLPPHDPRAKTFYPDLMPDYEEYRKHGFDAHTDILFLLDKIK